MPVREARSREISSLVSALTSPAVEVTKHSWRGRYTRLIQLSDVGVSSLAPNDHRLTNQWDIFDIQSVSQRGSHVILRVAGGCSLCGITQILHFSLPTTEAATALQTAIDRRLIRQIGKEQAGHSPTRKELPSQLLVEACSNRPSEVSDDTDWEDESEADLHGSLTFDVHVTINKARNLPAHSFLWPNAVVECLWGVASDAKGDGVTSVNSSTAATPVVPRRAKSSELQHVSPDLSQGIERGTAQQLESATHPEGAPLFFRTREGEFERSNPRWAHEASFVYSANEEQLRSRFFELKVARLRWPLQPLEVGTCRVRLDKIASGPNKYDLPLLHSQGGDQGRLVFTVHMVQRCRLTLELTRINCVMRSLLAHHTSQASQEATLRESSYSFSGGLTIEAVEESQSARTDFESVLLDAKDRSQVNMSVSAAASVKLVADTTAKAFENESLRLCIWSSNKDSTYRGGERLAGEMWLPITKVFSPNSATDSSSITFSEVLWLNGQRVGRLSGLVSIFNGPKVVQLPGGFFTERGILPLGPIAAGLVVKSKKKGVTTAESTKSSDDHGGEWEPSDVTDFEKPAGLKIPKEVEWLLSLVQSLKKVILDLHLDPKAYPDAPLADESGAQIKGSASSAFLNLQAEKYVEEERDCSDDTDSSRSGGGHTPYEWGGRQEIASRRLQFLLSRLQMLLGLSSKESTKAFFYGSSESLQWTQRLMLRLWAYLISQVDHVVYKHQPLFLETLNLLMLRGEFDWPAFFDAPASLLSRYQRTLWDTTGYVIGKLNRKAAPAEVRAFCSQALAVCFFRLPVLRETLLQTIMPDGENRHKHVREWNLPWSLQKSALAEIKPPSPARRHPPPPHAFTRSATLAAALRSTVEAVLSVSPPPPPPYTPRHSSMDAGLRALAPPKGGSNDRKFSVISPGDSAQLFKGRPSLVVNGLTHQGKSSNNELGSDERESGYLEMLQKRVDRWGNLWSTPGVDAAGFARHAEKVFAGKYWRERLRKRGHCFFLLLEHWMRHVPIAVGWQPGELLIWREVPGYPRMIKAFLLEMKQRPILHWSESMVSCMCTVVHEDRRLMQVVVRVLIGRVTTQPRVQQKVLKHLSAIFGVLPADPQQQTLTNDLLVQHLQQMVLADHFKVNACALIFVYNHLDQLGEPSRFDMLQWLHERFGELALHWSRVVRSIYMHVVVVKVLNYEVPNSKAKSSNSLDLLMGSTVSRTDSVDAALRVSRTSNQSATSRLQARAVSLSNLATLNHREAEYADLCSDYEASLDLVKQAVERPLTAEECEVLFQSAVIKKWNAFQSEVDGLREGCESGTLACKHSSGSISSNGSLSSFPSNGYPNGHFNSEDSVGESPLVGGLHPGTPLAKALCSIEPSRAVRQLTLTMNVISDDMSEDDDTANADEW